MLLVRLFKKKINTAAGYGGKIIQGRSINSSDNGKVIVEWNLWIN